MIMTFLKGARKNWFPCFVFCLFLSLTLFLGNSINKSGSIAPLYASYLSVLLTILKVLGTGLLLSMLLTLLLQALFQISLPFPTVPAFIQRLNDAKLFFPLLWASLFLLYVPYLLAYFPGIFSYDLPKQTQMIRGLVPFTTASPPVHTLLWKLFLSLEAVTGFYAVTGYALIQIICLSGIEAAILRDMTRRAIPFFAVILSWLFFALNPVIGIFSVIPVSDVVFGLFLLRSIPDITDLVQDPENFFFNEAGEYALSRMVRLALCILGACLFRENAFYAYAVFFPVLFLCTLKNWKEVLLQFVPVFILWYLITNLLFPAMGIQKADIPERYSVSTETLKQHPGDSADAFLGSNPPSWYLGAKSADSHSGQQYIETGLDSKELYPVERYSLLPAFLGYFRKIADGSIPTGNPVFFILFSIALPGWVVLLCALVLILKKRGRDLLILLPVILYNLTLLPGPAGSARCIFPVILLFPSLLGLLLTKRG